MTDRGLPIADGAPACPFVAFEDDRDERGSVPDHRHRCYAEARPTPRAFAHQQAYCLSSAFPVCPTFQDWARREAAQARGVRAADAAAGSQPAGAERQVAADRPDESRPAAQRLPTPDDAVVRPAAGTGSAPLASSDTAHGGGADEAAALDERSTDGEDAAEWSGHQAEGDAGPVDGAIRRNPPRDWAAPPPWLASAEEARYADADPPAFLGRRVTDPGAGLAGSAADRLAGGAPGRGQPADDPDDVEWSAPSRARRGLDAEGDDDRPQRPARRPRAYSQHLGGSEGPDWERPRRYEAFPTIRTRVGMPHLPRNVLMAGAVAVLAVALFFLPGILGLGSDGGTPGASGGPSHAAATPSVSPTEQPGPTPFIYTIRKNDTLSKIATAHGITIEELLAANPSIKNPNRITEGQQITIPVADASVPDTFGGSPGPSVAP